MTEPGNTYKKRCKKEWVSNPLDSINSILKDPMLIIEGMLQRYSDVGDVKGYDYLAFMIGGEVLTTKDVSELIKLLKNVSGPKIPKSSDLELSDTVLKHGDDIITHGKYKGELARPYLNSKYPARDTLIQEIMDAGKPVKDTFLPNGLRWDIPGSFNGRGQGIWELVIALILIQ